MEMQQKMRTRSGDIYDLINRREQTVNQQDEELDFANDSANMGMLAQGLSNAVRGLGSFQGKMPENPTAPLFRMRGDQAYRDLTARRSEQDRGDKMLLENLDLSKFAEEEKRKDEELPPSSRLLLQQRIRQLPIDGTEQIELPEGMTIRQVENDPVLGQLLKELIPKSGNINEEIKRAELLSEQQRQNLPMSDIDRSILQKKLTGSGIDVTIPDTMTYGQANENPYLKQFTKSMNGFGNDLGMMRFGFEQQRYEIDRQAREDERKARKKEKELDQIIRSNERKEDRIYRDKKDSRIEEKERKKEEKSTEEEVKKLSGLIGTSGLPGAWQTMKTIDERLPPPGKDVPGFGATGMLPSALLSKEGKELRAAFQSLLNVTLKDRSGAAVTPPEFERLRVELGNFAGATDQDFRDGIRRAKAALQETTRNILAGYPDDAYQSYINNGGTNFKSFLSSSGNQPNSESEPMKKAPIREWTP
jgi:hypothetical protein